MFKVNSKETRTKPPFHDFFFKVTYSGVFNVNFEHISHLQKHEICQNMNVILEKRKKSNKLNRFKIEVCFLPNIRFWRHGYYYYQILKSQYRNHLKNKYMDFPILLDIYCINCLRKWKAPLNGILALISK